MATNTDDPNTLIALASDEAYFVRRQARNNPNTPRWVLELLVRAGATPDLRGKGDIDPDLDADSLRRLVETGPWARQLVAEHPNTSAEVLTVLRDQPSIPMRLAVAGHANADAATLAVLGNDIEAEIRSRAVVNSNFPPELIKIMVSAGSTPDLQEVTRQFLELAIDQLTLLTELGAWGRFLVARYPQCPVELLASISHDPEWRVRSGLLDNPNTPITLIQEMLEESTAEDQQTVQTLSQAKIERKALISLAKNVNPEVRLSLARHPAATAEILGVLATDGIKEIRRLAANHPNIRTAGLNLLVRAGSTPDLMALSEPDPTMPAEEIQKLLAGGIWARQLAVRHPNTDPETVARLLCDREPKIREWAAVHPNLSLETKQNLIRAGSGTDFQGIMPPDPTLPAEILFHISQLGSWGEWVVANNPNAPLPLLESLADSVDWQVRLFVAKNPKTSPAILKRLEEDVVEKVRQAARTVSATES